MKTLLLLAALVAVTAVSACDPRGTPTEGGARAVTGIVELRFGPFLERYDLRVDRQHDDFAPTLTPIGPAQTPRSRTPTRGLLGLAFVRLGPGPDKPFVIPTPQGTVTARLTYKPLGPWQVLDRAAISVTGSPVGLGPEFTVAVLEPRLVR